MSTTLPLFAVLVLSCWLRNSVHSLPFSDPQLELYRLWGSYSPYFSVNQYPPPPPDCIITQVCSVILIQNLHLSLPSIGQHCISLLQLFTFPQSDIVTHHQLQRHGARFPTPGATARILAALHKLHSATTYTDPNLRFLTNYTYFLGMNNMVPLGVLQYARGMHPYPTRIF